MPSAAARRWHRSKLVARLGPAPVVELAWFKKNNYQWGRHYFGVADRPASPKHITQKEFPGFLDEMARLRLWRQRKRAGVQRPARGLWAGAVLPAWAKAVSTALDHAGVPLPAPGPVPPPKPSPHPNPRLAARAQRVLFTAWRPLSGRDKRVAVTADLNVAGNPAQHRAWCEQAVRAGKERGQEVPVWANQSQVGIDHVWQFASDLGASYIIWQAETIGEMADVGVLEAGAIRPGSPFARGEVVLVGNANAWSAAQRETATSLWHDGRLGYIQEEYTSEGDPWPDAYGTQGVPTDSICPAVGWGRTPYQLPEIRAHTPAALWPFISPYIAEGYDDSSWAAMPW